MSPSFNVPRPSIGFEFDELYVATDTPQSGQGGGPGPNLPAGMLAVVDTGFMTGQPAQVSNTSWTVGSTIQTTMTNFSQLPPVQQASKIMLAPTGPGLPAGGTGIATQYDTGLTGGNNYVSWGFGWGNAGTGKVYTKFHLRFRNWNVRGQAGTVLNVAAPKLFGLNTGSNATTGKNANTNHIWSCYADGATGLFWPQFLKQINAPSPGGSANYFDNDIGAGTGVALLPSGTDFQAGNQNYVMVEYVVTQETNPGVSGDARIQMWVGGVACYDNQNVVPGAHYSTENINLLYPGCNRGWPFVTVNSVWGGAAPNNGPAATMFMDMDRFYIAVA